jgi:soluble lytic murein transglycosylase
MNKLTKAADELPKVSTQSQVGNALQLLPGDQVVRAMASVDADEMRQFILTLVQRSLPEEKQDRSFAIARAVIVEANHNHMDPLFLLAVISTESQFNIEARGSHGEIGLMQIMPKTAKWLANEAGVPENFDLEDPAINIRIGATYIARLRLSFNSNSTRYVAAYNMGSANVRKLLAGHTEPALYPARVLNNYTEIYTALEITAHDHAVRGVASLN